MKLRHAIVFLGLIIALGGQSLAQIHDIGTFVGTVNDAEGQALVGATVMARNSQTGLSQSVIANRQGRYRLERLPRGLYDVSASIAGFKTMTKTGIELVSGAELKVDFVLQIGAIEEEVTVIGKAPLIETTRAQVSTIISEKEILSYPQGNRNYLDLVSLTPGATTGDPRNRENPFAMNGQRGSSTQMSIDGVTNTDDKTSREAGTRVPLEAIQEFKLVSNNFTAEYGNRSGAILDVITKSGTNQLHGSGWTFYRGDSGLFQSADWLTRDMPPYQRYQYGGTLGGPIIKDKTFFHVSVEGIRLDQESRSPSLFFTPEAIAGSRGVARQFFDMCPAYPVPTYDFKDLNADGVMDVGRYVWDGSSHDRNFSSSIKVDHVFNKNDRISVRWLYSRWKNYYALSSLPGGERSDKQDNHTAGLTWLHIFGQTVYNELRLGFHSEKYWRDETFLNGNITPSFSWIGGGVTGIGNQASVPWHQFSDTYQLVDVLNIQKGNHSIKLGGEARLHALKNSLPTYWGGIYYITPMNFLGGRDAERLQIGTTPPPPPDGNPYVPGSPSGEWKPIDFVRKYNRFEAGLFIQDDWRVSDRLTLAFGLRWEYFGVPREVSGKGIDTPAFGTEQGFLNGQVIEGTDNREGVKYMIFDGRQLLGQEMWNAYYGAFAPKFSFAYDLTGDGKTSLRGGFGLAYDKIDGSAYINDGNNYPNLSTTTFLGAPSKLPAIYPTLPASIPQQNALSYQPQVRLIDPNLRPSMAYNWLIGVQRELASDLSIEVNYNGSLGRRLRTNENINRYTGDGLDGRFDGINRYLAINGGLLYDKNMLESDYHALQVMIQKRFSNGWSLYTNYTYSKALDHQSGYYGEDSGELVCYDRPDDEWGRSQFDRRHRLVGGAVWALPFWKDSRNWVLKNVLGGWQLASIFFFESGAPFTVKSTTRLHDYNLDGFYNDRPLWVGDDPGDIIQWQNGAPYFDESLFAVPARPAGVDDWSYYDQNFAKRNMFTWFPTYNVNMSLQKHVTVRMGGRDVTLQFIAEVFNVLKTTFWNMPGVNYDNSLFGDVSVRQSGKRSAQVSVRFVF